MIIVPAEARGEHAGLVGALAAFRMQISSVVIELRSPTTRAGHGTGRSVAPVGVHAVIRYREATCSGSSMRACTGASSTT